MSKMSEEERAKLQILEIIEENAELAQYQIKLQTAMNSVSKEERSLVILQFLAHSMNELRNELLKI
jgi:hypothetical protein